MHREHIDIWTTHGMVDHGGATTIGRFPCAVYSENNWSITVVLQQDLQQSHPGASTRDTFEQYFDATSIAVPCAHRIQNAWGRASGRCFPPRYIASAGIRGRSCERTTTTDLDKWRTTRGIGSSRRQPRTPQLFIARHPRLQTRVEKCD